ncbi:MAG: NifU family protein [Flavobacteriales bacterium]
MSTTIAIGPRQREQLTQRVNAALTELRPFLEADGGDITLDGISEAGVVTVRLHGACSNCSMSAMTMKAGVEEAIKRAAPEVVKVEAV